MFVGAAGASGGSGHTGRQGFEAVRAADGPDFAVRQFGVDHTASATRVFAWCGDDTFTIGESVSYCDLTIDQCFAVTMANSCYHLGYWSQPPTGFPTRIQNSHAMHLGIVDTNADGLFPVRGGNTIFKGWSDGFVGEENYGRFLVTIAELDVWGPIRSRVWHLGNRLYPFGIFDRARKGQIANWTINGLRVHQTPGQVSIIESLDASNTPHHIAITNSSIGGTPLTAGNWTTFVSMSPEAYQITVNGVRVDRIDTTGTATLQLGGYVGWKSGSNDATIHTRGLMLRVGLGFAFPITDAIAFTVRPEVIWTHGFASADDAAADNPFGGFGPGPSAGPTSEPGATNDVHGAMSLGAAYRF